MVKHALMAVALVILGFITFSNSLNNPFLIDDNVFFDKDNTHFSSIIKAFAPSHERAAYYRPIADAFPLCNYFIFGKNPFGYHVVNVLLWAGAAWVLYYFLLSLFGRFYLAAVASVLYLVHPINGITVNYITASVFSLQVIFMLFSLKFLCQKQAIHKPQNTEVNTTENPTNTTVETQHLASPYNHTSNTANTSKQPRSIVYGLWSMVFFLLSLMCHESAFALPLFALVLWRYQHPNRRWREAVLKVAPIAIFAFMYFTFLFKTKAGGLFVNFLNTGQMLNYVATIFHLIGWYLSRFIYPEGITLMRAVFVVDGALAFTTFASVLLVFVAIVFIFKSWGNHPVRCIGLWWLAIGFIPMLIGSAITPSQGALIEPHWFVFSSIGFFLIVADLLAPHQKCMHRLTAFIIASLMAIWIYGSWQYNKVWSREDWYCGLWHEYNPQYKSSAFFLANAYAAKKQYDKAKEYYFKCLKGNRKDWIVYTSLANVEMAQGHWVDAKAYLKKALTIEPRGHEAWVQCALIAQQEKDYPLAIKFLKRAFVINPKDSRVLRHLGDDHVMIGDLEAANDYFERADEISPCINTLMVSWMRLSLAKKDKDQQIRLAKRSAECSQDPMVLTMAGSILGYYQEYQQAMPLFEKALRIDPQFNDAKKEMLKWRAKAARHSP